VRVLLLLFMAWYGLTAIAQPDSEPYIVAVDLRDLPSVPAWTPGDPIRDVPRMGALDGPRPPADLPVRRDPLLRGAVRWQPDLRFSAPELAFDGQGFSGVSVPDTVGDVGPVYYIQSVNGSGGTAYAVFNKLDGTLVAGPFTLDQLAPGAPCAFGAGDGIVLYDSLAKRWLLSEFLPAFGGFCVYISRTEDPVTGGFYVYSFEVSAPDYPKYGVWSDAYYVTSNDAQQSEPRFYAMEREAMLAGDPASIQVVDLPHLEGFGFDAATPADLDGRQPPPPLAGGIAMRHRDDELHTPGSADPDVDFLEVWELAVDWDTPENTALIGPVDIPVSEFDSDLCGNIFCIPVADSNLLLDTIREVVMHRLVYRRFGGDEVLIGNFITDVDGFGRGGIRWFVLRRTQGGPWQLFDEGTHAPDDSDHRWMGSIAMDKRGNIALGYNISGPDRFPGLRYTGRKLGDPAGMMTQGELMIVEGVTPPSTSRYGDYAAMSVDPLDDCTFWFTGQHNPAPQWQTQIVRFRFDDCSSCDLSAVLPTWLEGALTDLVTCINQNR